MYLKTYEFETYVLLSSMVGSALPLIFPTCPLAKIASTHCFTMSISFIMSHAVQIHLLLCIIVLQTIKEKEEN